MPHKIDVELTSDRGDGTWTWRASGAREPKGVVAADLLHASPKVGDVLRAEVEVELDGITVLSVVPPRQRNRDEPERLELLGPARPSEPVTTEASSRGRRGRGDSPDRPPRRTSGGPRRGSDDEEDGGAVGDGRRPRRAGRSGTGPDQRSAADRGHETPGATERPARRARAGPPASGRDEKPGSPGRPSSPGRRPVGGSQEAGRERPRRPRFTPGHAHRDAALAALPPEQRPVAEQVLRGGIPAVRQAVEAENLRARAEQRPEIQALPLLSLAEELRPRLQAATWRDRAEAAAAAADEIPLRELRSVVAASDSAPHDQESRLLAASLRDALERRTAEVRARWAEDIGRALDEGKLRAALQASAGPPDPGARLPAELAMRLGAAAGQALSPELPPEQWSALLEVVAASPVRRVVKPAGLPPTPGDHLVHQANQLSGRVPGLAALLGLDMPPPPGPPRPRRLQRAP
jgi:hypothetical protein